MVNAFMQCLQPCMGQLSCICLLKRIRFLLLSLGNLLGVGDLSRVLNLG